MKAERFRKAGDGEGVAVWLRILEAAEELLSEHRIILIENAQL